MWAQLHCITRLYVNNDDDDDDVDNVVAAAAGVMTSVVNMKSSECS